MDSSFTAMVLGVEQEQLKLLRFRNNFPAFGFNAGFTASCEGQNGEIVKFCWENRGCRAEFTADLRRRKFQIQTLESREICG